MNGTSLYFLKIVTVPVVVMGLIRNIRRICMTTDFVRSDANHA